MILALGDIHGNMDPTIKKINKLEITDAIILQVGDFGYSFADVLQSKKKYVKSLLYYNDIFKHKNIIMYVVRGNHDNPKYFNGEFCFSNLKLMPDYSVFDIKCWNVLALGGATSVDRCERKVNKEWWSNEKFTVDVDRLQAFRDIDIVISHNIPTVLSNTLPLLPLNNFFKKDVLLESELISEKKDFDLAYSILKENNKIAVWVGGHWHRSASLYNEHTLFRVAGINELVELI